MRALFTLISGLRHLLMGCILLGILATGVLVATPGRFSESVLEVANQDIVTFRGTYDGTSPAARVERALARIQDLPPHDMVSPIELVPVSIGPCAGLPYARPGRPCLW